jgi:menaquinone-dependent protoporphyrinogen oxidase
MEDVMVLNNLLFLSLLLSMQSPNAEGGSVKKILIVYGSTKGATAEIAGTMKKDLAESTYVVDTVAASASKIDLSQYDLIIIGSGIYGGRPHKNIQLFIDNNRTSLNQKKVAVFAVCGKMCSPNEKTRNAAMSFAGRVACGLTPARSMVFAGNIPAQGWFGKLMIKMLWGAIPGDHRDWEKIKAWTISLGELVR